MKYINYVNRPDTVKFYSVADSRNAIFPPTWFAEYLKIILRTASAQRIQC